MLIRFGIAILLVLSSNIIFTTKAWSDPKVLNIPTDSLITSNKFEVSPEIPDANQIFDLVNTTRKNAKVPPLRPNKLLGSLAAKRASDMTSRQYYAHKNPDGKYYYDLLQELGIKSEYSCENLNLVFTLENNQALIDDWANSIKGHRECMLSMDVVEAGYATAKLTMVDFNGSQNAAFVIVAIHSTPL